MTFVDDDLSQALLKLQARIWVKMHDEGFPPNSALLFSAEREMAINALQSSRDVVSVVLIACASNLNRIANNVESSVVEESFWDNHRSTLMLIHELYVDVDNLSDEQLITGTASMIRQAMGVSQNH